MSVLNIIHSFPFRWRTYLFADLCGQQLIREFISI